MCKGGKKGRNSARVWGIQRDRRSEGKRKELEKQTPGGEEGLELDRKSKFDLEEGKGEDRKKRAPIFRRDYIGNTEETW